MKYIIALIIMCVVACKPPQRTVSVVPFDVEHLPADTVHDTIRIIKEKTTLIHDTIFLPAEPVFILDTSCTKYILCKTKNEKLVRINDSLSENLFHVNSQIDRVRFYLDICMRNPSQTKYLKGWIRRVVE